MINVPQKLQEIKNEIRDIFKVITINVPEVYLDYFSYLETEGVISCRSDGIRKALDRFIEREKEFQKILRGFNPENSDYKC